MALTRVFLDRELASDEIFEMPESAFRHLIQVLRMTAGAELRVFNGRGGEFEARIESVAKRSAQLRIGLRHDEVVESPLHVTLVQGIGKGDRMDWAIQKAVELGVSEVVPIQSERCNVNLNQERQHKRLEHWRGVMISACEQSGRTMIPHLHAVTQFEQWCTSERMGQAFILDPEAAQSLPTLLAERGPISVLVGPEGGFSTAEISHASAHGCIPVRLGPRVLRTETAGLAAIALIQALRGDFAQ